MSNIESTNDEKLVNLISHSESISLIKRNYLFKFFLWIIQWVAILLLFIWLIDPYGVSPFHFNLAGINSYKPKRLDIDRLIKPFEVWYYQPTTIFLGTSRIQQSIDPTVLDGTKFAPAYNAAVPAATINENAAFLEQYIKSDPNLKNVFFELFIYAFIGPSPEILPKGTFKYILDVMPLQFSSSALFDSLITINYNLFTRDRPAYIHANGYWVRPNNWDIDMYFVPQNFSAFVLGVEKKVRPLQLYDQPFTVLKRLQDLCESKGIKLTFIITPNYPWDDYRLVSLGYKNFVREFYKRVSTLHNVYSFAQNTGPTVEPVSKNMKYWSEPLHFSRDMGALIQTAIAHPNSSTIPSNFMLQITPATFDAALKTRFDGLALWLNKNYQFATIFDNTKQLVLKGSPTGKLDSTHKTIVINGSTYLIEQGIGAVETIRIEENTRVISGWAIDTKSKSVVDSIIAISGNKLIAQTLPDVGRYDIEDGFGKQTRPAGFTLRMPITTDPIRVFAIKDKRAQQLASEVSGIIGEPMTSFEGHLSSKALTINGVNYPIINKEIGSFESAEAIFPGFKIRGWASDVSSKLNICFLVATVKNKILAISKPTVIRSDVSKPGIPAGFAIDVPSIQKPIRLFAIMEDGTARQVSSGNLQLS